MLTQKNIRALQKVVSEPDLADTRYELGELLGAGGMGAVYRVHDRDLKPQNILVAPFGETLVVDWGIARALSDMRRDRAAIAGTPAYMAPEQLERRSESIDARADVFALGRILWFMLTGTSGSDPDS